MSEEVDGERVGWIVEARIADSLERILNQISPNPGQHSDSIELALADEIKRLR